MTEPNPTHAEIARSLALAFQHDLVDCKLVRLWADSVIETSSTAEPWMIDLSFCNPNDVAYYLRSVPGSVSDDVVRNLLFGLAADAHRTGAVDAWGLRDIGWAAYESDPTAPPDHWGLDLDLAIETHIDGFATIVDVDTAVAEAVETITPYINALPPVLTRG
ncbi:hypothetical protein [Novipirellula aureliae]|nr:hypothetical protein [Novipirellula aureliae]